ncbi:TraR/DksA family transcriptional regulator [Citrobacter freundii]|uniref:TraR/DksA family transcriptional regulator n=1 Tax=Citrobacter TaxID=544 RepID=UPI000E1C8F04|nr:MULTISPECIES: TraR/DksA family transcriptional regulator [Citrobacter]MBQ5150348.1 TraR/DksA family transcriptional regulator [Citrobacter freundii]RDU19650.1 TraR/DksA family transcriptional regulator [Citrobacter freundii]TKU54969.1 TraR/DksA family transcriptional regulator [Citrobacter sp. wls712]HEI8402089.1 TraR/DksA family transcriptional regulator [Citrobacter freundii]
MTAEIIDQANELTQQRIDMAIAAHRLNRNAVSAEHCAECGDDIPGPRRAAVPGCQTCADCQSVIELKNKQRGIQ